MQHSCRYGFRVAVADMLRSGRRQLEGEGTAVWAVAFMLMYAALRLLRKWRKNGQMPMTDCMIKSVEE